MGGWRLWGGRLLRGGGSDIAPSFFDWVSLNIYGGGPGVKGDAYMSMNWKGRELGLNIWVWELIPLTRDIQMNTDGEGGWGGCSMSFVCVYTFVFPKIPLRRRERLFAHFRQAFGAVGGNGVGGGFGWCF